MKISVYKRLGCSFIHTDESSNMFKHVRLYSHGNHTYSVYLLDGYGKIYKMRESVDLDDAKESFRQFYKEVHND